MSTTTEQNTYEHTTKQAATKRPHVVIVGGGFGGLTAAKALGKQPVEVTLIDHNNFHLFQPMLYQVSTGGLAPFNITNPLRAILHENENTAVLMAKVQGVDTSKRM